MDAVAITVRVPATSANLGAGFDCLGMALDLFAEITVTFADAELPPTEDVGEKMVVTAVRNTYSRMGRTPPAGIQAHYRVSIPLGRGLGASAVARVAGVLAANQKEGHPLDEETCLSVAWDLEGHGDNASPAMFGGVQVCVEHDGRYFHVPCGFPRETHLAVLIPDQSMATKEARKALPEQYSKADAVFNISRAALFVAAMGAGDLAAMDEATQDRLHQPYRASLFPPLYDTFAAAKRAGAHAAWLSGAGSSIAALCDEEQCRAVSTAMLETIQSTGYSGRTLITRIAPRGAEVATVELVTL